MPNSRRTAWLLTPLLMLAACSDGVAPCSVAADCASGECRADGTCAPVDTATADPDATSAPDGGDAADATTTDDADATGIVDTQAGDTTSGDAATDAQSDGTSGVCTPNRDGTITRAELPLGAGLHATFAIAEDVAVDTVGTPDEDGAPVWDFGAALPGDERVIIEALDPSTRWFGDTFPDATYAARLSQDEDLLGVFRVTPTALQLLAVVSPDDGLFRTELTYDPPATLLAFPLTKGATWTSVSDVSGLTSGTPTAFVSETYTGRVDEAGTVKTPFGAFPALRAVVELDRLVGAVPYSEVQHLYVAECFGTVASVRSEAYASGPEIEQAAEIRRLAP